MIIIVTYDRSIIKDYALWRNLNQALKFISTHLVQLEYNNYITLCHLNE